MSYDVAMTFNMYLVSIHSGRTCPQVSSNWASAIFRVIDFCTGTYENIYISDDASAYHVQQAYF